MDTPTASAGPRRSRTSRARPSARAAARCRRARANAAGRTHASNMPRTPHALLGPIATHADAVDKEAGLQPVGVPPPARDHVRDAGPMTLGRESTTDEVLDGVDLSGSGCWWANRSPRERALRRARPARNADGRDRVAAPVGTRAPRRRLRGQARRRIPHVEPVHRVGDRARDPRARGLPRHRCRHRHRRRRRWARSRIHGGRSARGHESGGAHGHRSVARSRRMARGSFAPVRPRPHAGSPLPARAGRLLRDGRRR